MVLVPEGHPEGVVLTEPPLGAPQRVEHRPDQTVEAPQPLPVHKVGVTTRGLLLHPAGDVARRPVHRAPEPRLTGHAELRRGSAIHVGEHPLQRGPVRSPGHGLSIAEAPPHRSRDMQTLIALPWLL